MNREPKRPVTVEDLLQLKRAERPAQEFWTTFERDLRAKQLAALVEKRPWWQSLPRFFGGFSRYHLPVGATAIAVLSFFAIREYRLPVQTQSVATPITATAAAPAPMSAAPATVSMTHLPAVPEAPIQFSSVAQAETIAAADEVSAPSLGVVPVVAMLGEAPSQTLSPSARTIAANRAMAQAVDPELANRYLNTARGFEARAMPSRQPVVEPLAQVSLSDARRARQFVAALPVAFNTTNPASSEKIARKISDERLYDTVSRFGASGDRVKFKF